LNPLLSIVIPTKNRRSTAEVVLSSLNAMFQSSSKAHLEVIVFDTSDDNGLKQFCDTLTNIELRYIFSDTIGFSDTFNAAVQHAIGDYVTIIGDDDMVLPEILDLASFAKSNNISSISTKSVVLYNWQDFYSVVTGRLFASTIIIDQSYTSNLTKYNLKYELVEFCKRHFLDFTNLPRIYYGLVARQSLTTLTQKYGQCFFSVTPDISNAVALSEVIEEHYVIDFPIFIAGASANSGAGRSASGNHIGELTAADMLKGYLKNYPSSLPQIYSPETVWSFAAIETLQAMQRFDLISLAKIEFLYGRLLGFHPRSIKIIVREIQRSSAKKQFGEKLYFFLLIFTYSIQHLSIQLLKLLNRFVLPRFGKGSKVYSKVNSFDDLIHTINLHKQIRKISLVLKI
jgi:glycosyltransferase involved in cell wall biosynthesis